MRVDNPRFTSAYEGEVICPDCPLEEFMQIGKCQEWMKAHRFDENEPGRCPTAGTYDAACLMAEEAAKGGKG